MSPPLPSPASRGLREMALATFVLATVAMLVLVLPTWLLDVLLAANVTLSVAVMVIVLYARDTASLSAFPTVLLLTTLFRLALNVSSSRLILLQGDAGSVIRAFGGFVVRGNVLVGAVVFAVLTIVQYVVIARGAERVAEVSARFSLDALPGRQLAIDAELRAGTISPEEARARREELGLRSQFFGAMDGAMKFVKGDVIATVVIAIVNVVFGLVVGVAQRGLPIEEAVAKYVLLAVGDGLVSQVPALVLSTAAGILVTRTARAEVSLGDELVAQLAASPRALATTGVFVLLLGLVPGLPLAPFAALGALSLLAAWGAGARAKDAHKPSESNRFLARVKPISIRVGPGLFASSGRSIDARLEVLRDSLFAELGLPLRPIACGPVSTLGTNEAAIALFEVPLLRLTLADPKSAADDVARAVEAVARKRAAELLGPADVQRMLDTIAGESPIVRSSVPKPISVSLLTDVLRRLLDEGVSCRDLEGILGAIAPRAGDERDPRALADVARGHLRRAITHKLTQGARELDVVLVDPLVEDALRRGTARQGAETVLALPPAQLRDVTAALLRAVSECREGGAAPVVLSARDTRRFVRTLLEVDAPDVAVVSDAELLPEVALRARARAHLAGLG
ncbi:MAG: flagellar biosynthesis protein FlhA [Polyangiaceae bacterium]